MLPLLSNVHAKWDFYRTSLSKSKNLYEQINRQSAWHFGGLFVLYRHPPTEDIRCPQCVETILVQRIPESLYLHG